MRSKLLFFFQAEDGIRSLYVTEFRRVLFRSWSDSIGSPSAAASGPATGLDASPRSRAASRASPARSEERRVGKSVEHGGRRKRIKKNSKDEELELTRELHVERRPLRTIDNHAQQIAFFFSSRRRHTISLRD